MSEEQTPFQGETPTAQPQHTPGPWRVRGKTFNLQIAIVGPSGELSDSIAYAWGQNDEAEANARLIAAAPELLEALESAVGAMQVLGHPPKYGALAKAQAALAKARGGAA